MRRTRGWPATPPSTPWRARLRPPHRLPAPSAAVPCHSAGSPGSSRNPRPLPPAQVELSSAALSEQFGVRAGPADWLELDSSTGAKFSRHLVCRLPGAVFRGTQAAGAFVRSVVVRRARAAPREGARAVGCCGLPQAAGAPPAQTGAQVRTVHPSSRARASLGRPPQAKAAEQRGASSAADALFVRKEAGGESVSAPRADDPHAHLGKRFFLFTSAPRHAWSLRVPRASPVLPPQATCVVDCAVYTRNRAFRLYLSSKASGSGSRPLAKVGTPRSSRFFSVQRRFALPPPLQAGKKARLLPTARFGGGRLLAGRGGEGAPSLPTPASAVPELGDASSSRAGPAGAAAAASAEQGGAKPAPAPTEAGLPPQPPDCGLEAEPGGTAPSARDGCEEAAAPREPPPGQPPPAGSGAPACGSAHSAAALAIGLREAATMPAKARAPAPHLSSLRSPSLSRPQLSAPPRRRPGPRRRTCSSRP